VPRINEGVEITGAGFKQEHMNTWSKPKYEQQQNIRNEIVGEI
jgi:hypothetical protein